ncbi:cell wall / vacuolar inhibitor of fructosidase 2-like [Panicum miliaceum]|uniref:Cell wall / vacuolar inhibitor of fructosidase 2-like n=1 Tax=Panicum miliaceum TaxID=4540 RepID=A0A3L6PQ51_PANMI|nr:cell wall / vacuolar inhibitor of fructosidase 2-like [Panicum miliaceum]
MAPMATTTKNALVLLLLALLPLETLSSRASPSTHKSHGPKHPSPPPPHPPSSPPAPAALVRATCNSTAYYDLCMSTLSADPSSATADVRGLSAIAVSAGAANASGGAATAAALAANVANATAGQAAPSADATVQALLRTCAAKYGQARDALSAARGSIARQDYDYASVQVSAAAEYPQVCRVLFQRQRPGAYPAELAAREAALRQLCTVALDIITLLSNSNIS